MSKNLNIVISGGGTGGHIYPAIAIANELKEQFPKAQILFVGASGKMEMEKVPKAGYDIIGLPIAGFNRSNMLANLSFPYKLIKSLTKAYRTLKDFRPDVAIGVGGYASGPTLLIAKLIGVKSVIQEQNSYAGVTNKILAKWASKICVAYPNMEKFFPAEKVVFTGNPVRNDIIDSKVSKEKALAHFKLKTDKKTLLIIGGSQGARSINLAIEAGIDELVKQGLQVIWQTGKVFRRTKNALDGTYISDFIYEMEFAYQAADVVISRAGALSVSELCLTGCPSILVPFPNAAEDHQTMNALSLVEKKAALLVRDSEVGSDLINVCLALVNDNALQQSLRKNIAGFAKPNAAKEIIEQIKQVLET
ncbi:MAG: UDP-N-acetylglucosamine--N-acetylmuramyl-(pentapeptide) pyrophosphoryl-undecaprenol N-acetylglucosamine transferase [Arcticibacterium sp.]|jgi:UDP-N-acetylglucosamine--N-acetylmuramyl-(pentapeptide) pyrophosphoryl-undecaprenol N-acetylglucosamine transferase